MLQIQRDAAAILQPYFTSTGLVIKALEHASKMEHIMDFTRLRCLGALFSMLHQACRNVAQYNNNHPDFPMPIDQLERYMQVATPSPLACFVRSGKLSNVSSPRLAEVFDLCRPLVLLW